MKKYYKYICWKGIVEKIECIDHSYSWSGKIPCTGVYRCIYCGKIKKEENQQWQK